MIRLIRAFAWLHWRLFVNGLRGRRRDAMEQVSRVSRLLVLALLGVSFVPGSVIMAAFAFFGGRGLAQGNDRALPVLIGARAILAIVVIITALTPLLRMGGGAQSMTRLALLPIARGSLFATELASQLADPWVLFIIPPILALAAGLAAGGGAAAAASALVAGVLVIFVVASLGCFASLSGVLVFRHRRLGELASVGLLMGITLVAYLPILTSHGPERRRAATVSFADAASKHPWMAAAPWELYARAVEAPLAGRPEGAAAAAVGLGLTGLAFAGAARSTFGRLISAPADRRSRGKRGVERILRVPGAGDASSAVARTFFRLVTRSVRGRVILFTAPLPALLFGIVWRNRSMGLIDDAYIGVLALGAAGFLALLSMTSFQSDQFAVDRAGLTLTFLSPVSGAEIVAGKALGGMLAFSIPVGIGAVAAAALNPRGSPLAWLATLLGVFAAYLAQSPVAAALAAWFPAPFDLSRLKGGNPHPLASILASLACMLVYTACGATIAGTLVITAQPAAALAASVVVLALAAAAARWGWRLAGDAVDARRENLAMTAQGR